MALTNTKNKHLLHLTNLNISKEKRLKKKKRHSTDKTERMRTILTSTKDRQAQPIHLDIERTTKIQCLRPPRKIH